MKLILTGPTAVGKTAISLGLAQRWGAEIISSDSRQCYRYLNIGTATPTAAQLQQVKHHNVSIIDPVEKDSAGRFYERSMDWEPQIEARGKHVLYVGGSTLHQQCIIQPFDEVPAANAKNIETLEQQIEEEGLSHLYKKLQEADPTYAEAMDGLNRQRIIRALDVWMQTGKPFSSFHSNKPVSPPEDLLVCGLHRQRQKLYERINKRVDAMFDAGFLEEVEAILAMGYSKKDPGLNTVGYKQAIAFLEGHLSREQMMEDIKTKTRRYAKRQLSWFRKWNFVQWIDLDQHSSPAATEKIVQYLAAKSNKE